MDHLIGQRGSRQFQVRRYQFPDSERSVNVDGLVVALVVSAIAERAQESGQPEDVVAVLGWYSVVSTLEILNLCQSAIYRV